MLGIKEVRDTLLSELGLLREELRGVNLGLGAVERRTGKLEDGFGRFERQIERVTVAIEGQGQELGDAKSEITALRTNIVSDRNGFTDELVLLVENHAQLLHVWAQALRARGAIVLAALDALAADRMIESAERQYGRQVSAAVVDYRLPGEDGLSFLRRFSMARPGAALVLTSGSMRESVQAEAEAMGVRIKIKPWQIDDELLPLVREVQAGRER